MAYVGRNRGIDVEVFVAADANPIKVDRMKAFGAIVSVGGPDFDSAKQAARRYADTHPGCVFVEDGDDPAITEGAGTIGIEILRWGNPDTLVIPLGDGALITGIAAWVKQHSPNTRIIGVCPSGAPAMFESWRAGRLINTERGETIADTHRPRLLFETDLPTRYYIPPEHGDSHFLSASADECTAVLAKIGVDPKYGGYIYETPREFYIALPDTPSGACVPAGSTPGRNPQAVFRLWNKRADSNHRYTTDSNVRAQMIARGYVSEGYGPLGVTMCTPNAKLDDSRVRVTGVSPFVPGCETWRAYPIRRGFKPYE